jgi:hypothetical protein
MPPARKRSNSHYATDRHTRAGPGRTAQNESGAGCRDVDMTEATHGPTSAMTDDRKLTEVEIEAFQRDYS